MLPREGSPRLASRSRSRTSRPRVSGLRSRNTSVPRRMSVGQLNVTEPRLKGNVFTRTYASIVQLIETTKTMALSPTLWRSVLRGSVFFLVAANLYATAWGTYATFYAHYLPVIANSETIYFNYGNGAPLATILASKNSKPKFFSYGQAYDVFLELEVPESETNLIQGNFMVRLELTNAKGNSILVSERPGLVKYRSSLLRKFMTAFYSIPLVLEMQYEKQTLSIKLAENFWEDYDDIVNAVSVRLSNPKIQIYSSRLLVKAHLTGLKYLMYQWPTLTAAITTTLFFLGELLFALLAWQGVVYLWGQMNATNSIPDPPPSPPQQSVSTEIPEEANVSSGSIPIPSSPGTHQPTTEEEEWERLSATYLSGGAITPPSIRPIGAGSSRPQTSEQNISTSDLPNDPDPLLQSGQYFGQLDTDSQTFNPTPLGVSYFSGTNSNLDMDILTYMAQSRNQTSQGSQLRPIESDQRSGTLVEPHEETSVQSSQNLVMKDDASSSRFSDSYPTPALAAPSRLSKKDSKDKDL